MLGRLWRLARGQVRVRVTGASLPRFLNLCAFHSLTLRRMKRTAGRNQGATNTVILVFDLAMVFAAAALYRAGKVDFAGVLIPSVALMSSFGPVVALANLGSTLQSTFAAGSRLGRPARMGN